MLFLIFGMCDHIKEFLKLLAFRQQILIFWNPAISKYFISLGLWQKSKSEMKQLLLVCIGVNCLNFDFWTLKLLLSLISGLPQQMKIAWLRWFHVRCALHLKPKKKLLNVWWPTLLWKEVGNTRLSFFTGFDSFIFLGESNRLLEHSSSLS